VLLIVTSRPVYIPKEYVDVYSAQHYSDRYLIQLHDSILQPYIPVYSLALNYCFTPTDLQGSSHMSFWVVPPFTLMNALQHCTIFLLPVLNLFYRRSCPVLQFWRNDGGDGISVTCVKSTKSAGRW